MKTLVLTIIFAMQITVSSAQTFFQGTYVEEGINHTFTAPFSITLKDGVATYSEWNGKNMVRGKYHINGPNVIRITFDDVIKGSIDDWGVSAQRYNVEWGEDERGKRWITVDNADTPLYPFFPIVGRLYLTGKNAVNPAKREKADVQQNHRRDDITRTQAKAEARLSDNTVHQQVYTEQEVLESEDTYNAACSLYEEDRYASALNLMKKCIMGGCFSEKHVRLAGICAYYVYFMDKTPQNMDDAIEYLKWSNRLNGEVGIYLYQIYADVQDVSGMRLYEKDYFSKVKPLVDKCNDVDVLSEISYNIALMGSQNNDTKATAIKAISRAVAIAPDSAELLDRKGEILLKYKEVLSAYEVWQVFRRKFNNRIREFEHKEGNVFVKRMIAERNAKGGKRFQNSMGLWGL